LPNSSSEIVFTTSLAPRAAALITGSTRGALHFNVVAGPEGQSQRLMGLRKLHNKRGRNLALDDEQARLLLRWADPNHTYDASGHVCLRPESDDSEQVADAILDYYRLGITSFLIRGFDPLADTTDFGRELIPRIKAGAIKIGIPGVVRVLRTA
jgi:hypothetical protein